MLSARKELLLLHRKIYLKQKKLIDESVSHVDRFFKKYEKRYLKNVRHYEKIVDIGEITELALKSDIIFVGDYHTLNQSQRSLMRVLRTLIPHTKDFILAMETFHKKNQKVLDRYMSGRLSDETFLKQTGFKEHWFFDLWQNFKPIFDFAKYYLIPVFALESAKEDESLKRRDIAMAKRILELSLANVGKKIIVFVGDLHLAKEHLPFEVHKVFKQNGLSPSLLTLFQNSEDIYWKLASSGLEENVHAVKISATQYCRMHTPPIIAQQSYLNWLEHEEDVLDFSDARATFLNYLEQIANYLELSVGPDKENVEVYTCGDLSFLKKVRESGLFKTREIKKIKDQILREESYYIPQLKMVYLANVSVNHAAEEASHTLKHLMSGDEIPRHIDDAFYAAILHESLGFFGSKIINPRRKCLRVNDYKNLIVYLNSQRLVKSRIIEFETARLFLEHAKRNQKGTAFGSVKISGLSHELFFSLIHAIGYSLGEKLFYGLLSAKISKSFIKNLFLNPFKEAGESVALYLELYKKLEPVKLPKKI